LAAANPAVPQSWNRYAYVVGDPVNGNDPLGLDGSCGNSAVPNASQTGPPAGCNTIGSTASSQGWTSWNNDPTGLSQGGAPTLPVDQAAVGESIYSSGVGGWFWLSAGAALVGDPDSTLSPPQIWQNIAGFSGGTLGFGSFNQDTNVVTLTLTVNGVKWTITAGDGGADIWDISPSPDSDSPAYPSASAFTGPTAFSWAPDPGTLMPKCQKGTHPDPLNDVCVANRPTAPIQGAPQPPPATSGVRPSPVSPTPPVRRPLRLFGVDGAT
jgi:hypothetical protein